MIVSPVSVLFSRRMSEKVTLLVKRPYLEFFQSVFSQSEYEEMQSIFLYLVGMRENKDQKNSEYEHFARSVSMSVNIACY